RAGPPRRGPAAAPLLDLPHRAALRAGHRQDPAPTAGGLHALAAGAADAAVADGPDRLVLPGRRHRMQDRHRGRRPLPLLRDRHRRAPRQWPRDLPGVRPRAAGLRLPRRGAHRHSTSARSAMMFSLLPTCSAATVTPAVSIPPTSRATIVCSRSTVAAAITTGSMV